MKKLSSILKTLQIMTAMLEGLRSAGVDTDRLIQISNAQGPQAHAIRDFLAESVRSQGGSLLVDLSPDAPKQRQIRGKSKSTKKATT